MTREEAIAYGESKKTRIQEKLLRAGSSYGDYAIYYSEMAFTSAAIAALREQEERDNPRPLTLEELQKMDGEPVWVETGEVYEKGGRCDYGKKVMTLDLLCNKCGTTFKFKSKWIEAPYTEAIEAWNRRADDGKAD